jgi:hypothetical protein
MLDALNHVLFNNCTELYIKFIEYGQNNNEPKNLFVREHAVDNINTLKE